MTMQAFRQLPLQGVMMAVKEVLHKFEAANFFAAVGSAEPNSGRSCQQHNYSRHDIPLGAKDRKGQGGEK